MAKKILVAGGAGYIGCKLVSALLEAGYDVRVYDKLYFGAEGLNDCRNRIELEFGDIKDITEKSLDGIYAVINLAGLSNDPTAEYNPEANRVMNTESALHLAWLSKSVGIRRYIFASSCSIYYSLNPDDELRDEDYPVDPKAPYSHSKYMAERGLLGFADRNFSPVILRKGTVYGQSPRMRYDLVVNVFTRDSFKDRRLILHANGRMWRPLLNIDNAVRAYLAVLEAPEEMVHNRIFNVLDDNYKVIQVAYEVRRTLENRKGIRLDLVKQEVGPVRSYRVDGTRFREAFDVDFSSTMASSIEEMWDKLEEGTDYNHSIYYNLAWLELLRDMEKRLRVMNYQVF